MKGRGRRRRTGKGTQQRVLANAGCVFLETTTGSCPGTTVYRWGRETHWEAGIAFFAAVLEKGTTEGGTSIQPTKRQQRSRQTIIQSPEQIQCAQDQPSVCINKHHPATTASVRVCRRSPPGPCYPSLPIPAHRHWNHCRGVEGGAGRTFECNFKKTKQQPLYKRIEGHAAGIWCWAVRRGWARGGVDHIQSS